MKQVILIALACAALTLGASAKAPLWEFNFDANKPELAYNPTVFYDLVFVPTNTSLRVFRAATGAVVWKFHYPNGDNGGYVAVSNTTVYVGCLQQLYALDISSGTLQWSFAPPTRPPQALTHLRPSLGLDALYLTTGYSPLMKLNPNDGALIWETAASLGVAQLHATEGPSASHVYVVMQSATNTAAVCLDAVSGVPQWNVSGIVTIIVSQQLGLLFCQGGTASASQLSVYELGTGKLAYIKTYPGMQALDYYVYGNDLYVDIGATTAPFPTALLALDAATGVTKWTVPQVSFLFFIPCSKGVAVFGASDVQAFAKSNGASVWRFPAVAVNDGAATEDDIIITITATSVVAIKF